MSLHSSGIVIRYPRREEIEQIANLILRFYRVNEEFDPLYALKPDADKVARKLAEKYLEDEKSVILIAVYGDKIVGLVRGEIRENPILESSPLGVVVELYVHPSYRRRGLARLLISEVAQKLKEKGAKAIAAEFPQLNEIALNFYKKLGFRPLTSVFVKEVE